MNVRGFLSKNLILVVMIPALAGAHYGWYKLQFNDKLVSPEERENLPLLKALLGKKET